jgi:hypothetical protein
MPRCTIIGTARIVSAVLRLVRNRSDQPHRIGRRPSRSTAGFGRGIRLGPPEVHPRAVLGRGTSLVIRAFDRDLLRDVAIKILNPDLAEPSNPARRPRAGFARVETAPYRLRAC